MIKKVIILWVAVVLVYAEVDAQFYHPVPLHGQIANHLCWAAGIKMIANYHNPGLNISQCDLAVALYKLQHEGNDLESVCDCSDPCIENEEVCDEINNTIPLFFEGESNQLEFPYFQLMFRQLGFKAMEEHKPLSWIAVKNEIDNCRPLLLTVSITGGSSGDHVIVGKGYYYPNPGDPFLVVNDPWDVCTGCTYLLNYSSGLSGQLQPQCNGLRVTKIKGAIHHISPWQEECDPCKDNPKPITTPEEISLISKVEKYKKDFIGTRFGSIFPEDEFNSYVKNPENRHYVTNVFHLSARNLSGKVGINTPLFEVLEKGTFQNVTYNISKETKLIAEIGRNGNCVYVDRITDCLVYANDVMVVNVEGQKFILNNDPFIQNSNGNVRPYSIIKYDQAGSIYARFKNEEKTYWYSLNNTKEKILPVVKPGFMDVTEERVAIKTMSVYTKAQIVKAGLVGPRTLEIKKK